MQRRNGESYWKVVWIENGDPFGGRSYKSLERARAVFLAIVDEYPQHFGELAIREYRDGRPVGVPHVSR